MKMKFKKKELLKLPVRDWKITSEYDSIVIAPTGKKRDAGFMEMAIIGFNKLQPVEIAGYCSDISWLVNGINSGYELRSDMLYPSGLIHFWSGWQRFRVSHSLSSMDIKLINRIKHG